MYLLKSNECLFWYFSHEGQLKSLGQFEARVYSSFQQVAHVQMGLKKLFIFKFTYKLFCIIGIMIVLSTLGFFPSSVIVSNNHVHTVKIKS